MGKRSERAGQIKMAYSVARQSDPKLPLILIAAFIVPLALSIGLAIAFEDYILTPIVGLLVGVMAAMLMLSRRVNKAVYHQLDGADDAAARILSSMRGAWTLNAGVAMDPQKNLIHRVIGRCGIVLVGEGPSANRMKQLMVAEKRRVSRVAAEAPVYEVLVGDEPGMVPLKKLQGHLQKLPRNLRPPQVRALAARMRALNAAPPMPKGPMPTGRMPRNRIR